MAELLTSRIHKLLTPMLIAALLGLAACGGGAEQTEGEATAQEDAATEEQASLSPDQEALVQKLAELADAIEAAPEGAAGLLAVAGMTAEEFEAEIYRISADPALARAYEAARAGSEH